MGFRWLASLTPQVRGPVSEIDSHNVAFAVWSVAHEVGVVVIVWLEAVPLRLGVLSSHRLSVAR